MRQLPYVDLSSLGDTGEDTVDSIAPTSDGEAANQTTFRRPSENLRERTEILRDAVEALEYYRDYGQLEMQSAGTLTWDSATGLADNSATITLKPLLAPAADTKGILTIGVFDVNEVLYEVAVGAYATEGMNRVTVAHTDVLGTLAITVTISDGPIKRIEVTFDSTDVTQDSGAAQAAVAIAVAGDLDLVGRIVVTDNGGGVAAITAQVETFIEGTADNEQHVLAAHLLNTFTVASPLTTEGDGISVWYYDRVEEVPFAGDPKLGLPGGRAESNPSRGSSTIPIASLFNPSDEPEKIPGAIPICKRMNGQLVFANGQRVVSGSTVSFGFATNVYVDSTPFQGISTLVVAGGISDSLPNPELDDALLSVDQRLGHRRTVTWTCSDGVASTGGNYNGATALATAITDLGASGGTIYLRRGTYTLVGPYVIPANVTIIGEARSLVILAPTNAGAAITLSAHSSLENLTISPVVVGAFVVMGGDHAQLSRVLITNSAILSCSSTHAAVTAVEITGATSALAVGGSRNCVYDTAVDGYTVVSGTRNTVVGLDTGAAYAHATNPVLQIAGDYCVLERIQVTGNNTLLINNNVIRYFGAFECTTSGLVMESTVLTGVRALEIDGCSALTFNSCVISPTNVGIGIHFSNTNSGILFNACKVSNTAFAANQWLVQTTANDTQVKFSACVFDDNEVIGCEILSITGSEDTGQKIIFDGCTFYVASSGVTSSCNQVSYASFVGCTFYLKNPGHIFEGDESTALFPFFAFQNTLLQNCVFDLMDSTIRPNAPDPDYSGSGLVFSIGFNGIVRDVLIRNWTDGINMTPYAGWVNIGTETLVDNLQFTTCNASGLGTVLNTQQLVTVTGSKVKISNLRWIGLQPTSGGSYIRVSDGGNAVTDVVIDACYFASGFLDFPIYWQNSVGVNGFNNCTVSNSKFGTTGVPLLTRMRVPLGDDVKFINNHVYTATVPILSASGVYVTPHNYQITGNYLECLVPTNYTAQAVQLICPAGTGTYIQICNNIIYTVDSLTPGIRPLLYLGGAGAAVNSIGVGNIFVNSTGTVEDGDLNVASPVENNVGF